MNKQEALVAILEACRTHEQPHEETRRVDPSTVHELLLEAARDLEVIVATEGRPDALYDMVRDKLVALAGGALYLLVDEVTVVPAPGSSGPVVINGAMMMPTQPHIIVERRRA